MIEEGAFLLLADVILWVMYAMLLAALVAVAVSVVRTFRLRGRGCGVSNGIPQSRIAWCVLAMLLLLLGVTFLLGSSRPLLINGTVYQHTFWLKATDMFICSSLVLLLLAALGVAFGVSGWSRRLHLKKK